MNISTSKTCTSHCTTYENRIRIQSLYFDANWTEKEIALQLHLFWQVEYTIASQVTSQKKSHCGQKIHLSTPQRKHIVDWVMSSKKNWCMSWPDIPLILHLQCSEKAIQHALKKKEYICSTARCKPSLLLKQQQDQLNWVWKHLWWNDKQWNNMLWLN